MSTKDQRQTPRINSLNLSYYCLDEEGNTTHQGMGRTLNISSSGILLEINEQLPQGVTIDMEIAMQDDIIHASGTIIHNSKHDDDTFHTGIHFTTISDDDKKTLAVFA